MKLFLIIINSFFALIVIGQNTSELNINRDHQPLIYVQNNLILGKHFGPNVGLTVNVYRNTYLGLNYSNFTIKAENVDEKFQSKVRSDEYQKYGFQIGQLFHTTSKNVKFMISINPYYGKKKYVKNFKATFHPSSGGIDLNTGEFLIDFIFFAATSHSSHYTYDYEVWSQQYMGCALRPELLVNFNKGIGFSLGASVDCSSFQTNLSGEIGLIYGALSY